MRYGLAILLAVGASAQVPTFGTDQQIKLYEQWVARDAGNGANVVLLAGALVQKTRETADFGYLDRASKVLATVAPGKDEADARRLANIIALTRHQFREAADGARALLAKNPKDSQSLGTLGDALLEMGEYAEAAATFQKMADVKPGLTSLNRLAYIRFLNGDTDGGIAMMRQAVGEAAKFPENLAWCLTELGHMYFKTGRWHEAEKAYSDAVGAFPAAHAAHAGLGSVYAARGDLSKAAAAFGKAQSIVPMVQYAGALFELYSALGDSPRAASQAALVDAVERLESAAGQKANRTLALILANQGRNLDRALELARADLELRHDVFTHDALAWVLYKRGSLEEASAESIAARKLGSPEPLFDYHAGMIALSLGKKVEARTLLESALERNPGFDYSQSSAVRALLADARR